MFWRYIVAAFWADFNTILNGNVSWEIHNDQFSSNLVDKVNNLIQREYGDANFTGTWMIVGFWENVTNSYSSDVSTHIIILLEMFKLLYVFLYLEHLPSNPDY